VKPVTTWAALATALLATATLDLSAVNGAFGLSAAEWTVVCFVAGITFGVVSAVTGGTKGEGAREGH